MSRLIVRLSELINGSVSVTKLKGWRKKLKAKANVIELKRMAKKVNYDRIRF